MKSEENMPKRRIDSKDLLNPTLEALRKLGGSGTNKEIHDEAVEILGLTDEQVQKLLHVGNSNRSEFAFRLGWARTWLKRFGLVENTGTGVWSLTQAGLRTQRVDAKRVVHAIKAVDDEVKYTRIKLENAHVGAIDETSPHLPEANDEEHWRDVLYHALISMKPDAFEHLFQRILRESGFTQVEVTGRSGDGGIDGIGVVRIGGFLSFRVLFQCKRWKNSIGPSTVRDFRGAMQGRTDKGLIVTTGSFTRDAVREATRDGAPEIDLIDGEQLMDTLKQLSLGVKTEQVVSERVTVNPDFFANI